MPLFAAASALGSCVIDQSLLVPEPDCRRGRMQGPVYRLACATQGFKPTRQAVLTFPSGMAIAVTGKAVSARQRWLERVVSWRILAGAALDLCRGGY
jgi:hypothetical protein